MDGFETDLKMMELMGKCQRTEVGSRECDECDSREEVEQSGRKEGRKEGRKWYSDATVWTKEATSKWWKTKLTIRWTKRQKPTPFDRRPPLKRRSTESPIHSNFGLGDFGTQFGNLAVFSRFQIRIFPLNEIEHFEIWIFRSNFGSFGGQFCNLGLFWLFNKNWFIFQIGDSKEMDFLPILVVLPQMMVVSWFWCFWWSVYFVTCQFWPCSLVPPKIKKFGVFGNLKIFKDWNWFWGFWWFPLQIRWFWRRIFSVWSNLSQLEIWQFDSFWIFSNAIQRLQSTTSTSINE